MTYTLQTFRDAGLESKWAKTFAGRPIITVRNPNAKLQHQREKWWVVTKSMFENMTENGVIEGFERETLLGNMFYAPL